MTRLKFYAFPASAPSRSVQILLDLLNLKYDYIVVNPLNGDTQSPDFLVLNPQHQIPVLEDDTFILSESRAILTYLASRYAQDDHWYPKEVQARARVDMRLYFDLGTFYPAHADAVFPVILDGASSPDPEKVAKLNEVLKSVSNMVRGGYVAGTDKMTVADVAFLATYSTIRACGIADFGKFHFLEAWYNRCKQQVSHFERICGDGATEFARIYRSKRHYNSSLPSLIS